MSTKWAHVLRRRVGENRLHAKPHPDKAPWPYHPCHLRHRSHTNTHTHIYTCTHTHNCPLNRTSPELDISLSPILSPRPDWPQCNRTHGQRFPPPAEVLEIRHQVRRQNPFSWPSRPYWQANPHCSPIQAHCHIAAQHTVVSYCFPGSVHPLLSGSFKTC